jgi:hypothetical protein
MRTSRRASLEDIESDYRMDTKSTPVGVRHCHDVSPHCALLDRVPMILSDVVVGRI